MLCRAIPYEGREPYIFFSYSHKDSERVYPLLEQMVRDGYRVWYDDGNHPGDDWLENIGQHLNDCHLCLAMMSQNSEASHNCKKEVSFAVQSNKRLMAVMLEQFAMTVGMRLQLSTIHYLVKTEFPSDKALLEKLYETEDMQACRAVPGSLPMRAVAEKKPVKEEKSQDTIVLESFMYNDVLTQTGEETTVVVENKPKTKTLKVKAKAKVKVTKKTVTSAENDQQAAEAERLAAEKAEAERLAAEKAEAERLAAEKAETERLAAEKAAVHKSAQRASVLLMRLADGRAYNIDKDLVRVGRSEKRCDIVLENNHLISNHHMNIIVENGICYVQDAGSSNGTFVNGERLKENEKVSVENAAALRISKEEFLLFYRTETGESQHKRAVAFLRNPTTQSARALSDGIFFLDRQHKWEDGSLSNVNVSRKHAQISCDSEGFYLEDLGSKNGTFCNEQKIAANTKYKLGNGDKIRLVDTVLEFNVVTF